MIERWLHLLSSFWLPQPYLTQRGIDRGEERTEFWFLVTLYTSENFALLLFSTYVSHPNFPFGLLVILVSLVTTNILAVLVSIFYTTKVELFCGLPHSLPNMPSFGPGVRISHPTLHQTAKSK